MFWTVPEQFQSQQHRQVAIDSSQHSTPVRRPTIPQSISTLAFEEAIAGGIMAREMESIDRDHDAHRLDRIHIWEKALWIALVV